MTRDASSGFEGGVGGGGGTRSPSKEVLNSAEEAAIGEIRSTQDSESMRTTAYDPDMPLPLDPARPSSPVPHPGIHPAPSPPPSPSVQPSASSAPGISPQPDLKAPDPNAATPFPPMHRSATTPSTRPYSAFTQPTKYLIILLSAMAGIFSPISSNIFVPAIPTLAADFHRSQQDISLAVTVFLVFQAISPSFFGSLSDSAGRRPVYMLVMTIYLGANVGLALVPTGSYWLLLFLRCVQAIGGSAVLSIGSGCVSDIAEPRERGKYWGIFQLGAMTGPCLGPLIGGLLAGSIGWRSIFWFLAIASGVVMMPLILCVLFILEPATPTIKSRTTKVGMFWFMPETLRSLVGDGSIPPPPICMSPKMLLEKRKMERQLKKRGEEGEAVERPPKKKYDPFSAFKILFVPEILLVFIFVSLLYMEFYCIITLNSTALKDSYGLSEIHIGLAYLPSGIGSVCTSLINGRQLDYFYRREERRVGGDYRKKGEEFSVDFTRLRCLFPFIMCFLVATTALGWCLQARAPLAATLVVQFFVGLGTGTINTATVYGQDLCPGKGGAVSASLNLVRCLFGAVGTAVVQIMYRNLGAGWTTTILSGICLAGTPILWVVITRAKGWREARVERALRREQARKESAVERG